MEVFFLILLICFMAGALASGFPVAFALPGSAILTIFIASLAGYLFTGDTDAFFVNGGPNQWLSAGVTNFRSLYWNVERDTLIAIPLFIFMGLTLQRSHVAEDLLIAMAKLFGPIPGGLGIAVVFVGALLAATTGIVGATVIAMGLISLPAMLRNKYSHELACGTICASGTLGQIIPPSIVLIILVDQLSNATNQANSIRKQLFKEATGEFTMPSTFDVLPVSAGDMFMGALIPGMILVGLYMLYIFISSMLKPDQAPPVAYTGKYNYLFFIEIVMALVPPLVLIFIVLGSILLGVATVNQAGAIGAVGVLFMASYRLNKGMKQAFYPTLLALVSVMVLILLAIQLDINVQNIRTLADLIAIYAASLAVLCLLIAIGWAIVLVYRINNTLNGIMIETAKTTSMVFIILMGAAMLTSAFRAFGGEELVKHALTGLSGGFWVQFLIVMVVIFLLGFFLDFIEIAIVVVPIVAPVLLADPGANVTAVWLGVMIGLNIQTSFLTPPFGFALFYLRGVATKAIKTLHIYKGVIPFILLQITAIAIVGLFPLLVNYLPNRSTLMSDTAPPPNNPYLQACIEETVFPLYQDLRIPVTQKLLSLSQRDTSFIPEDLRQPFDDAIEDMPQVFSMAKQAQKSTQGLDDYAISYAPLHKIVSRNRADIQQLQAEIKQKRVEIDDLRYSDSPSLFDIADLQEQLIELNDRQRQLETQIPMEWRKARATFVELQNDNTAQLNSYRRLADSSYSALMNIRDMIGNLKDFYSYKQQLASFLSTVKADAPMTSLVTDLRRFEQAIAVHKNSQLISSHVRAAISDLAPVPNLAQVIHNIALAIQALEAEINWRSQGVTQLLPALDALDQLIKTTIGLRMQSRLPEGSEGNIATCLSEHKDISLFF